MNESELAALLHRSESETLDFKRDQYPFAGKTVTDDEKSELLKDIISVANAWKTSDGYILIGVDEKNGRASQVRGVITMLDDHSVQQFINSKTNRPVSFRIVVADHQNVKLTVIHIDKAQKRPIYLAKNFGPLKKEVVYIRRGSSTDEAAPDEIADMGREESRIARPDVSLEFEFTKESREEWRPIPSPEPPKIIERDFFKIYAINHKGGLAEHLQGSVWIPTLVLVEAVVNRKIHYAKTLEEVANGDLEQIEISNKFSDGATQQFMKPPPPDWHPFSSGKRLRLEKLLIFGYPWLNKIPSSIRWQFSVNGGDLVKGETKFSNIHILDLRKNQRTVTDR